MAEFTCTLYTCTMNVLLFTLLVCYAYDFPRMRIATGLHRDHWIVWPHILTFYTHIYTPFIQYTMYLCEDHAYMYMYTCTPWPLTTFEPKGTCTCHHHSVHHSCTILMDRYCNHVYFLNHLPSKISVGSVYPTCIHVPYVYAIIRVYA